MLVIGQGSLRGAGRADAGSSRAVERAAADPHRTGRVEADFWIMKSRTVSAVAVIGSSAAAVTAGRAATSNAAASRQPPESGIG